MLLLYIMRGILLLLVALLTLLQVTCNNPEEAMVKVVEGNVIKKGETIDEAIIIGREEGSLHKLKGHS
jgi:hypothetical protein